MKQSVNKNKITAVIPFFNEKTTINEVIEKTLNFADHVIAVDDGSDDQYLLKFNDEPRVTYLIHRTNLGKGAALKTGLTKSIEILNEFTITLDADLQHPPELIPAFVDGLKEYDICIGNRMMDKTKMPVQRKLSNTITSFMVTVKSGAKIIDSQNGFRAFKTKHLSDLLNISNSWGAETEMIILASRKMLKIGFIQIPTIYADNSSKMEPVKAIISFIKAILFK